MGITFRNTYDPEVSPLLTCTPEVNQYNRSYLKQLDVTRTYRCQRRTEVIET
jgi:hypothetical protein